MSFDTTRRSIIAAESETITMMHLLGALKSTTLPATNPMSGPEVRSAAEIAIVGRYAHLIRDEGFWQSGVVRSLAPITACSQRTS